MNTFRVRIEYDEETNSDPGSTVGWNEEETAAYVQRFIDRELVAYGVIVETTCNMGEWHHVTSLWGVDVETSDPVPVGVNLSPEEGSAIPGYVGEVVREQLVEAVCHYANYDLGQLNQFSS